MYENIKLSVYERNTNLLHDLSIECKDLYKNQYNTKTIQRKINLKLYKRLNS